MINRENLLAGTRPEVGNKILITAGEHFDGYQIVNYNGMVWGISVRSKDAGTDMIMGCKQTFGGELTSFTELADEGRQKAIDRMLEMARRVGANALINFRFHIENILGVTEVTAYATSVIIKPIQGYVPVGAVGNILADIADAGTAIHQPSPLNQQVEARNNPLPQDISKAKQLRYPLAGVKVVNGKLFTICPACKTSYEAELLADKKIQVLNHNEADPSVDGQHIRCDKCQTVFTIPTIEND